MRIVYSACAIALWACTSSSPPASNDLVDADSRFYDTAFYPPHEAGPPPLVCGMTSGVEHDFTSFGDIKSFVVRRWVSCDANGGSFGDAGFELRADGTFQLLKRDPANSLVPKSGPDSTGTYSVTDVGSLRVFQIDLNLSSGGGYTNRMSLVTDSPRMLLMSPLYTNVNGYVPETTDNWPDPGYVQPTSGNAHAIPTACAAPLGPNHVINKVADAQAALTGDWITCNAPQIGKRSDRAGIRIDANGHFESLVWDGTDHLAVATDIDNAGVYVLSQAGPTVVMALHWGLLGGVDLGTIELHDSPRVLHTSNATFIRRDDVDGGL